MMESPESVIEELRAKMKEQGFDIEIVELDDSIKRATILLIMEEVGTPEGAMTWRAEIKKQLIERCGFEDVLLY